MMKAFARAVAKRKETSPIDLVEAVLHERPDLRGKTGYPTGQGTEAHTVFIGGEFFKAPQDLIYDEKSGRLIYDAETAIAAFDKEIEFLQQLQGKGLPVPEITCVGKESVFYGMTSVKGVPLGKDFERIYSAEEQRLLARDIISFVVDMANALPQKNSAFITHDDLHCNNIFVDPVTRRLSGVIDFGMVKYCTKDEWFMRGGHEPAFRDMVEAEFNRRKSEIPDLAAKLSLKQTPKTP